MGADQTPDPTTWSDDQLDDLLDQLAQRAAERDDLDLPGSGASRRGILAGLLGLGGAAAGAGVASAIGESETYGSATGVVGTDSEPLNEANVQDLHAQDLLVDGRLNNADVSSAGSNSILVSDGSGGLTFKSGSGSGINADQVDGSDASELGGSLSVQTFNNIVGSRSADTLFTNNTGSPIIVNITGNFGPGDIVALGGSTGVSRFSSDVFDFREHQDSGPTVRFAVKGIVPDGDDFAFVKISEDTGINVEAWHERQIQI